MDSGGIVGYWGLLDFCMEGLINGKAFAINPKIHRSITSIMLAYALEGVKLMNASIMKKTLAVLLIFAVGHAQVVPTFAGAKSDKPRVAFVGISFQGVPEEIQAKIQGRLLETIQSGSTLEVMTPDNLQKKLGTGKIAEFFSTADSSAFRKLADELETDYVFAGRLEGQVRESDRLLLVGEFNRYDRASHLLHRFEVLKYYDNLGVELVKFKEEYAVTIAPQTGSQSKLAPWLVLGGVTVVGIVAMLLTFGRAGAEGDGGSGGGDRP